MTAARINENNIFVALTVGSWLLLALLAVAGLIFGSLRFATGIAVGGILAILNYCWLRTILERVLAQRPAHPGRFVQVRYVLRLALLALVIYWLITHGGIDIVGLLIGLSVIVIAIMALSI
jgi:hypothetical protein